MYILYNTQLNELVELENWKNKIVRSSFVFSSSGYTVCIKTRGYTCLVMSQWINLKNFLLSFLTSFSVTFRRHTVIIFNYLSHLQKQRHNLSFCVMYKKHRLWNTQIARPMLISGYDLYWTRPVRSAGVVWT